MHILYDYKSYGGNFLAFFDLTKGDNVAYGGFIAGTITGFIYLFRRKVDVWKYADCVIPAVGLGTCLTRIGCFLNGDDYGKITSFPLGVQFPAGSYPFLDHLQRGLISASAETSLSVHPVQLYLAANGLMLAIITAYRSRSAHFMTGEIFTLYWLLYAITRFLFEYLRGDMSRGFIGSLSTSQVISIPVFLITAVLLWNIRKQRVSA